MSKSTSDTSLTSVDPTLAPLGPAAAPANNSDRSGIAEGLGLAPAPVSRINGTWFLLAGAIAVSAGVLMGMRWVGMKGGISGKDMKFDESLVAAASRPKRDHAKVISDLNSSRVTQQVPQEAVKKNPFRLAEALDGMLPVADTGDPAAAALQRELDAKRRKEADRNAAIKTELQGFKLQTVLGGRPPLARISGKLVREGDKLGQNFKVKSIHGRTVDLECDGSTYEIGISLTDVQSPEGEASGLRPD